MSLVVSTEHPVYGRGMVEDRYDGPLDSQGVVLASGDFVYVEGTGRGDEYGSDWVGRLARVTSCPVTTARPDNEPVTDPAEVRVGLEQLTAHRTWGLPARHLRKLLPGEAVSLRLQIAERLRAIGDHDAAALRSAEGAAVERALVGELRARLAAVEAREDIS
jgi:hypothetical protein